MREEEVVSLTDLADSLRSAMRKILKKADAGLAPSSVNWLFTM